MTIVSDTTCLSALARIGRLEILAQLFGKVLIPRQVFTELLALQEFGIDTSIFETLEWLTIQDPESNSILIELLNNTRLDAGESFAIALALEKKADWLIIDDLAARKIASDLGLNITGLAGVLLQAKAVGIIKSVKEILEECVLIANFRLSQSVYSKIIELANE
jgi:uncharacterized protein